MKVYARCDGCKAEASPIWLPHSTFAMQSGISNGGYHIPPAGWSELGTFLLCDPCTVKVKDKLALIVSGVLPDTVK